jgi:hypothetical protein
MAQIVTRFVLGSVAILGAGIAKRYAELNELRSDGHFGPVESHFTASFDTRKVDFDGKSMIKSSGHN